MTTAYATLDRLLEVGRTADARQLLSSELASDPEDPELRVYAARVALRDGDSEEARLQLGEALTRDPTLFSARCVLFYLDLDESRYVEAEATVIELIRENPQSAVLIAGYADLNLQTLDLDKARALTDEALRVDPGCESARFTDVLLSIAERRGERADVQVSTLIADDPDGQKAALALMINLIENHRPREALRVAQELLRVQPHNGELVDLILELRVQTHPLALPLWPLRRLGWAASGVTWLGAVVLVNHLHDSDSTWSHVVGALYLSWAAYTWIYEPLMTRWLRWRGI